MTDKVKKIREEVERRMNCFKNERNTLLKASDNSDSSLMKHYVTHVLPLCDLVTQRHETRVEEAMANMDAN
jgi:hypothetical protein